MATSLLLRLVYSLALLFPALLPADESPHRDLFPPSDGPVAASGAILTLPARAPGSVRASAAPARSFRSTGQRGAYRPPALGRGAAAPAPNPVVPYAFFFKGKRFSPGTYTSALLRTLSATSSAPEVGPAPAAAASAGVAEASARYDAVTEAYATIASSKSHGTVEKKLEGEKRKHTSGFEPENPAALKTAMATLVRTLGAKDAVAVFREAAKESGDEHTQAFVQAYAGAATAGSLLEAADGVMKRRAGDLVAKTSYTTDAAAAALAPRAELLRRTFTDSGQEFTGDETTRRLLAATPAERARILASSLRMNTDEYRRLRDTPLEQLQNEGDRARKEIIQTDEFKAAWEAGAKSARDWQKTRIRLYGEEGPDATVKDLPDAEEAYRALLGPTKERRGSTMATVTDYLRMRLNDKNGSGMREFRDIAHAASGGAGGGRFLVFQSKDGKATRTMPLTGDPTKDGPAFQAMTNGGFKLMERYRTKQVTVTDGQGKPVIGPDGNPVTRTTFDLDADGKPKENRAYADALKRRERVNENLSTAETGLTEAEAAVARLTQAKAHATAGGAPEADVKRAEEDLAAAKADAQKAKETVEAAKKKAEKEGSPPVTVI